MFGKQSDSGASRSQSLIQEGVSIRGEVRSEGDLRLEGMLEGSLVTGARVIVGATGKAIAEVEAEEVLVMGNVQGRIVGHQRIELRKGAHVEGDLISKALVIEEGVFFQGLAQMTGIDEPASTRGPDKPGARTPSPPPDLGGSRPLEDLETYRSTRDPS